MKWMITCFATLIVAAMPCFAVDLDREIDFNIPAQKLDLALIEFSRQAKVQVITAGSEIQNLQTEGATGRFTISSALSALLRNSGLSFKAVGDSAFSIGRFDTAGSAAHAKSTAAAATTVQGTNGYTQLAQDESPMQDESSSRVNEKARELNRIELEEIVVTGTHIRGVEPIGSQVITYGRAQLESMGVQTMDDFARRLPQASVLAPPTQNSTGQISAHNTINLRGLSAPNTLVLINGRRGVTGNAFSSAGLREQVDISTIPISAIERIEILPSTASAIYGASAVAGVVNVVLRKDFRGTDVTLTRGGSTHGDGDETKVSLVTGLGFRDGKTNVVLSAYQRKAEEVLNRDRGYQEELRLRTLDRNPTAIFGSRPPASVPGNIQSVSGFGLFGAETPNFASVPAGYLGNGGTGGGAANSAPFLPRAGQYNLSTDFRGLGGGGEALQPETRDRRIDINITHALTDNTLAFFESFASERHLEPPFGLTHVDVVPTSNPFNPFGQDVRIAYVPLDVVSGGRNVIKSDEYRLVLGLEGPLGGSWRYTTDAIYHRLEDRSHVTATSGQGTGRAEALAQTDPLLAYNPFLDFAAGARNSQAVIDRIAAESLNSESTSLLQGTFRVSGIATQLPAGSVQVAGGIEAREERSFDNQQLHRLIASGDILQGGPFADRQRSIVSGYAESRLPVTPSFEASLAVRHEQFSDHGGTTNPQVALKWEAHDALTLRASWGTGFVPIPVVLLATNTVTTPNQSFPTIRDPRRGNEALTNVTTIGGGNPDLGPETSESIGVGLVWEPRALAGTRVTVDYFDISKSDILVRPGPQTFIDNEALIAGRVVRAPASPEDAAAGRPGPIILIDDRAINFTKLETSGLDLALTYSQPTRVGRFTLGVNGTYVFTFKQQLAIGGPFLETADKPIQFSDQSAIDLKGSVSLNWERGPWSAGSVIRYLDAYDASPTEIVVQGSEQVASSTEVDFTVDYKFSPNAGVLSDFSISLGVNNAFDRDPPFRGGSKGYSTFNDPRQRFAYLTLRKSF